LTRINKWPRYFALAALLVLCLPPLVHAGVGLEYLGPNPLRPQPVSGQTNTLQAAAIVGNTGDEAAIVTFTLIANQDFTNHFTYSFSDNNFSLNPGARKDFTLTLTFDPNTTPSQDYTAAISVVGSPASKSGSSGSAAFNLPVAVSSTNVPEFPTGTALMLLLTLLTVPIVQRTIKPKRTFEKRTEIG
jgi:hypothetical protein